jgi:hypothetical protein
MLYKYVPFVRKDILETRLLRFTQPGCFNDPFEMHPSFDLMSKADIAKLPVAPGQDGHPGPETRLLTRESLAAMLNTLMPGIQRTIEATVKGQGAWSLDNNLIARSVYDEKYGILSLAGSPTSLLMWAHYADSHRGFVIQFDDTHGFFHPPDGTPQQFQLRKVEYSSDRPVLSYSTIDSPEVFFRKSADWSHEAEWRFIKPLSEAFRVIQQRPFPVHLFQVPDQAISGVILGVSMPTEHAQDIMSISEVAGLSHVKIYQATLDKETYRLQIHPPLDGSIPPGLSSRVCSAR